jgi:Ca-activated chloride channel family protein
MKKLFLSLTLLLSLSFFAQKTITGMVSDDTGPLPGVSVLIKGTTTGTETDFDGKYSILTKEGDVLQFSYVGMISVFKTIGKSNTINVLMKTNQSNVLDEIVVTSYGVKRSLGGRIRGLFFRKNKNTSYYQEPVSNESYAGITENSFKSPKNTPLSTFSIDVDKASYSNIRRMINAGQSIPEDAVKIEEMINYFNYEYEQPTDKHPFAIHTEVAGCPWNEKHQLVKIGLQGKTIPIDNLPASNLVFLIDVSGSMGSTNKLPLLKSAFKLLVNQLREKDKVSIVVYAGAAGVVLKPTSGANKQRIIEALDNLQAGGSTAGGAGIELAYKLAQQHYKKGGNNRVILATDGDFNVGMSDDKSMEDLIKEKRKSGVYLTVLGFGMGNYKDSKLETLADKGNGNHAYIDTMQEAQRILGQEFGGTLFTIAKDVKIQVEFNPDIVQAYRLIGYENRLLNDADFKDDTIDAGEIGSGHSVTALYEIIPQGVKSKFTKKLPKLKYSKKQVSTDYKGELLTVKFRYKKPDKNKSIKLERVIDYQVKSFEKATDDFKFAAAVAMLGMQLRQSEFKGITDYNNIIAIAKQAKGADKNTYRGEFIRLVKTLM